MGSSLEKVDKDLKINLCKIKLIKLEIDLKR
jgi:hypothetical protein